VTKNQARQFPKEKKGGQIWQGLGTPCCSQKDESRSHEVTEGPPQWTILWEKRKRKNKGKRKEFLIENTRGQKNRKTANGSSP